MGDLPTWAQWVIIADLGVCVSVAMWAYLYSHKRAIELNHREDRG